MKAVVGILWLLLVCVRLGFTRLNPNQTESRLMERLLASYDARVRPLKDHNSSVVVHLTFTPMRVDDLDLRSEEFKITGWVGMVWKDEFLQWDPDAEDGVESLLIPKRRMWVPPLAVLNSLRGLTTSHDTSHDTKVHVAHTGIARYVMSQNFGVSCDVKIYNFPFDEQRCGITLVSWYHPRTEMDLRTERADMDLALYESDGEWILTGVDAKAASRPFSVYPFKENDVEFCTVSFSFSLSRRPTYYIVNVLIPCVMLCVLVLTNFFLPPDSGEKVSLGITVLLAFTVFQLLIAEVIPTSAVDTPILAEFLICIMATSTSSVLVAVFVLNLHHRAVRSDPPPWLRRLVLGYLANAMCINVRCHVGKIKPMEDDGKNNSQSSLGGNKPPTGNTVGKGTKFVVTIQDDDTPGMGPKVTMSEQRVDLEAKHSETDNRHIRIQCATGGAADRRERLQPGEEVGARGARRAVSCDRGLTTAPLLPPLQESAHTLNPDHANSSLHTLLPTGSKSGFRLIQSIQNLTHAGGDRDRTHFQHEFIRAVHEVYHELHSSRQLCELAQALEDEWKLIARVVDRLFFWLTFVFLLLTSTWVFSSVRVALVEENVDEGKHSR